MREAAVQAAIGLLIVRLVIAAVLFQENENRPTWQGVGSVTKP
jgi:hypothetical protein